MTLTERRSQLLGMFGCIFGTETLQRIYYTEAQKKCRTLEWGIWFTFNVYYKQKLLYNWNFSRCFLL